VVVGDLDRHRALVSGPFSWPKCDRGFAGVQRGGGGG
jgi:hypothetical protein